MRLTHVFPCAALALGLGASALPARAEVAPPKRLVFYYGYPSAVNGAAGDIAKAVEAYAQFDVVVFGAALELPQYTGAPGQDPSYGCTQNSHSDHDNTQAIITQLQPPLGRTEVFGYVSIGGENTYRRCTPDGPPVPLSIDEIKARIEAWDAMGVTGVFFDEAEYGFGSTRAIQDAAIDHAHAHGLRVFINGFDPNEIFGELPLGRVTYSAGYLQGKLSTDPMNPDGAPSHLGPRDLYLLEHYQVINGNYVEPASWVARADAAFAYRERYGTAIAGVTTQADVYPEPARCTDLFDQAKLDYAWWSSLLYGFEYVSWGEPSGFSAFGTCANTLTPQRGPEVGALGDFVGPVIHPSTPGETEHVRDTSRGRIVVDTATHTGRFEARGD